MPGTPANTFWSPGRTARAAQMAKEGYSASQIAADLGGGITRNAVIGKMHRIRAPFAAKPNNGNGVRKPHGNRKRERPRPREPKPEAAQSPTHVSLDEPTRKRTWVRFAKLEAGQCKWPVLGEPGPAMFCCGRRRIADTCPYCAGHLRLGTRGGAQ